MSTSSSSGFSVVTVTHNSGDATLQMIESVPSGAEMVLVDNASSDGLVGRVRAMAPTAVVCALTTNNGFGSGCNVGARAASRPVIIFLNPDCRPRPGALETLARLAAHEVGSIFGPALLDQDGSLRTNLRRRSIPGDEALELLPSAKRWTPQRFRRDLPADDPRYRLGGAVDYLQGACLAIDRDAFLKLGGFDEDFFLYSEEETLCDAVKAAGGRCIYVPDAVVEHDGGTSTEQVSSFARRHAYRSRAIFYRKRYGSIGAAGSILSIAAAAVVCLVLQPVMVVAKRGAPGRPVIAGDVLRGLVAGATAPINRR